MSALLLGGCFFLLLAIFGVQVARFALALEEPVKKKELLYKRVLKAVGVVEDLTVASWKYLADTKPSIMEIKLSDGTVWHGQEIWWWDPVTRRDPPKGYNEFLCELRVQIERKLLRAV
jgi:hypothetical protein